MRTTQTQAKGSRLQIFSALRHRNYRIYWIGMLIAITGFQVQMVATYWLVYDLTGSASYLGLAGFSQAASTILLSLLGGVVADRVDRRKLLMATSTITGALLLILATPTATQLITIWHILIIAFLAGAVGAFDQPARMALIPHLVDRKDLMNAVAMGSMVWQGSRIVGPSLAGILIALVGIAPCFYLTAVGFLAMLGSLYLVRVDHVNPSGEQNVLQDMAQGIGFILKQPIFVTLMGMTFFNSLFGMSYIILMPIFAKDVLHAGSEGYGFLMSASGVGALLGAFLVAGLGNFPYKGRLLLGGGASFGVALILFAFSPWFLLSLGILLVSGTVNSLYMTTVNTTLQSLVPDELRGRVMGVYSLTWSLMPLGGMVSGFVATLTSAPLAVGLGGALVTALAVGVAVALPQVRRL